MAMVASASRRRAEVFVKVFVVAGAVADALLTTDVGVPGAGQLGVDGVDGVDGPVSEAGLRSEGVGTSIGDMAVPFMQRNSSGDACRVVTAPCTSRDVAGMRTAEAG